MYFTADRSRSVEKVIVAVLLVLLAAVGGVLVLVSEAESKHAAAAPTSSADAPAAPWKAWEPPSHNPGANDANNLH